MTISLTPEQERIVNDKLASGLYASTDEIVSKALQLLDEYDAHLEELRRDVEAGAEQIKQGKYKIYKSADEFIDDIEKRAEARLKERQTLGTK